ncbi:MAG: FAD-binding protein [Proteobacteria bacterium]|nr:FAD-binding protein [Pseudomonadota bacterium]
MSRQQRDALAALLPEGSVLFDEAMSRHSAAGVGGPAEAMVRADGIAGLKAVLAWAIDNGVEYRSWGRGSSTVVRDGGISGIVIGLGGEFEGAEIREQRRDEALVSAGSACAARALCEMCAARGLAVPDRISGSCGTAGGALFSGRGDDAPGFVDSVEEVTIVTKEGRELTLRGGALRFETGALKVPRTSVVVRAIFRLKAAGEQAVIRPAPKDMRISHVFSSGCKTCASALIDEAGLRGVRVGGARVAIDDPNAIVNEGNATARDILVLMSLIRDRVREFTGVTLEHAIEITGER